MPGADVPAAAPPAARSSWRSRCGCRSPSRHANPRALWLAVPFLAANVLLAVLAARHAGQQLDPQHPARLRSCAPGQRAGRRRDRAHGGRDDRARAAHASSRSCARTGPRSGCWCSSATTPHSDLMRALDAAAGRRPRRPRASHYLRPPARGTPERKGDAKAGNLNAALDAPRRARARRRLHRDARRRRPRGRPPLPAPLRRAARGRRRTRLRADRSRRRVVCPRRPLRQPPAALLPRLDARPPRRQRRVPVRVGAGVAPHGARGHRRLPDLEPRRGPAVRRRGPPSRLARRATSRSAGAVGQHAPEDLPNAYKQRGTWAVDTIRLLLWGDLRGLSLRQRAALRRARPLLPAELRDARLPGLPGPGLATGLYPLQTTYGGYALHFWPFAVAIELQLAALGAGPALRGAVAGAAAVGRPRAGLRAGLRPRRPGWPRTASPSTSVTRKHDEHRWHWRASAAPARAARRARGRRRATPSTTQSLLRDVDLGSLYWSLFFAVSLASFLRLSWFGVPLRRSRRRAAPAPVARVVPSSRAPPRRARRAPAPLASRPPWPACSSPAASGRSARPSCAASCRTPAGRSASATSARRRRGCARRARSTRATCASSTRRAPPPAAARTSSTSRRSWAGSRTSTSSRTR